MNRTRLRHLCFNPVTYCWIGLLCAYVALYRRLAVAGPRVLTYWFNSDTLFPVHLFLDWFRDGYPLSGWRFGIAPCWFPDLPVTALGYLVTRNIVLANILDGLVQFVLLLIGFQLCWRAIGLTEARLSDSLTVLLGIGFVLCTAWRVNIFYPTIWKLFLPQTHISTLVVVMIAAAVTLRLFRGGLAPPKSRRLLGVLTLFSIIGAMGDPLFIPQMTFAMTIAAIVFVWLGLFRFRTVLPPLILGWSGIVAGRILNSLLFSVADIGTQSGISMDRFLRALRTFLVGVSAEFERTNLLHLSAALWLLLAFGAFLWLLRRLALGKVPAADLPSHKILLIFFLLFSALSGLSSAGAIVVGGSSGLVELRDYRWSMDHYLHSIFYEPAFGWALVLTLVLARFPWKQISRRPVAVYSALAAVILIPAAYAFSVPSPSVALYRYCPPFVRYLDSQAARNRLQAGAAGYWEARPLTLFSQQGLRAYAVQPSLEPNPWVSNRYWYTGTPNGSKSAPDYTFVIPEEPVAQNRKLAVDKLGYPDEELVFQKSHFLIYRPSTKTERQSKRECTPILRLSRELLERPGSTLQIPAWCFSGSVGEIVGKTRVAMAPAAPKGLLSFGPYLSLPAGRYAVTIYYRVERHNPGPANSWEIGYFCCKPAPDLTLARGTLEDGRQEIRTEISVSPELAARALGLELRIDYLGAERLVFEKITLERKP